MSRSRADYLALIRTGSVESRKQSIAVRRLRMQRATSGRSRDEVHTWLRTRIGPQIARGEGGCCK